LNRQLSKTLPKNVGRQIIHINFHIFDAMTQEKNGKSCPAHFSFVWTPGLPDGLFSNQKSQFGQILDGLRLENVDIFYVHEEYFTDTCDI
jgi:hypothetical protein